MSIIPIVVTAGVVAVTPPLRRRVIPVATATTAAVVGTGSAALTAVATVAITATEGLVGVARSALHDPGPQPES